MKKLLCILIVCSLLLLAACGSTGPSDTTVNEPTLKVGDIVYFGHYGNKELGLGTDIVTYVLAAKMGENPVWTEPIEWEVVNEYNGMLDLISTKALWKDEIEEAKRYPIETYLRGEYVDFFYEYAFTEDEKSVMGYYPIDHANESHDYNVVVPWLDDLRNWYGSSQERICTSLLDTPIGYWVLDNSIVMPNGEVEEIPYGAYTKGCIRPQICVVKSDLENLIKNEEDNVED